MLVVIGIFQVNCSRSPVVLHGVQVEFNALLVKLHYIHQWLAFYNQTNLCELQNWLISVHEVQFYDNLKHFISERLNANHYCCEIHD